MNDSDSSAAPTWDNSEFLASMGKAREAITTAQTATAGFKETLASIGEGLASLGEQFVEFGIDKFAEGIKNAVEQGQQFADQAKQTGQSVSTMVELQKAFEAAGVSGDKVTGALSSLNKALNDASENGKPAAEVFSKLGLSVDDLKKMGGVEQFQAIIKGLQGIPDAAGRASASQKMFGDRAQEMMGVLNDPKGFNEAVEGSTHYAKTMQQNAKAFEAVGQATEAIQLQFNDLYTEIAGALAPALVEVMSLIKQINFAGVGESLADGMKLVGEAFKKGQVKDAVSLELKQAFMEASNFLAGAMAESVDALAGALQSVFNPDFMGGISEMFLGVAQAFGAELIKATEKLISILSTGMEYYLNKAHVSVELLKTAAAHKADAQDVQTHLDAVKKAQASGDAAGAARETAAAQASQAKLFADDQRGRKLADISNMSYSDYVAKYGMQQVGGGIIDKAADQLQTDSATHITEGWGKVTAAMQPSVDALKKLGELAVTANIFGKDLADNQAKLKSTINSIMSASGLGETPDQQNKTSDSSGSKAGLSLNPASGGGSRDPNKTKDTLGSNAYNLSLKMPDADRWAKVGLFIGGAPQGPGLSEARRTAKATEEACKLLKQVILKTDHGRIEHAVYA